MTCVESWGESGKIFLKEKKKAHMVNVDPLYSFEQFLNVSPKKNTTWIIYVPTKSNLPSMESGWLKDHPSFPLVIIGLEVLQIMTILSSQTGPSLG